MEQWLSQLPCLCCGTIKCVEHVLHLLPVLSCVGKVMDPVSLQLRKTMCLVGLELGGFVYASKLVIVVSHTSGAFIFLAGKWSLLMNMCW